MIKNNKSDIELSDDVEVIGPGQLLTSAREKAGLTQEQVADKLNFRLTLVKEIESEQFDSSLPDTFNRGYLKNYAKLVDISIEDVLMSYESLNIAKKQGAEMQSFSKGTEKEAENNRIMWLSYLVLAILIAATIMWWMQNVENSKKVTITEDKIENIESVSNAEIQEAIDNTSNQQSETTEPNDSSKIVDDAQTTENELDAQVNNAPVIDIQEVADNSQILQTVIEESALQQQEASTRVQLEFTFSGDCWVNIYDATGERIAWGVKKSGYVMSVDGQAPFKVTLGKPELVKLSYDGEPVDLSSFNAGDIAKFELPII